MTVTGEAGGRREGAIAGPLLSGERRLKEVARGGVTGGGVTTGADRRRDERCCDRRGERQSHGRGQVARGANAGVTRGGAQALPEGASTGANAGGVGKRYRRGRPLV